MSQNSLQAACLGVGLVSAWAPVAVAQEEVRFEANLSTDVSHATLMLGGSGSGQPLVFFRQLSIPGSGSGGFVSPVSLAGIGSGYSMLGLCPGSGSGGYDLVVSIGGLTVLGGDLFESRFPGWVENDVIGSLLSGSPFATDFMISQFGSVIQSEGTATHCMAFSSAHDIGTVSFNVVPGPGALCSLPLVLLMRRRRR